MKFAFYTDCHISGQNPRRRVDDFPKAITKKIAEVYRIAEEENCEFVGFGGDFFHTQRIFAYDVIGDVLDIIGSSPIPTLSVIGEHDLYGHNIETFEKSTLRFCTRSCPNLQILWEPREVSDGFVVHPKHEPDCIKEFMNKDVDESKVNIMLCHELLADRKMPFEVFLTDSFDKYPYDIVLSGDLHMGFAPHKVEDCWFVNPGSLARRTTSEASRAPKMVIVEIEKGKDPKIELRRIKDARDGSEIFGENVAELIRKREDRDLEVDATQFSKDMMDLEAESVDIHELVKKAGESAGVKSSVMNYLQEKKIELTSEDNNG